ncbi:C6 transcription factor [Pyrenophora tritici-repentis]|nr:C6 transcription factor [Pyrenophora tritici-repentis]
MLQSYLESPLSPSSSQGATADTVPAANTEAPSNITNSQPSAARKPRVALACKRCKRRKQRCDGARPVCRSCERAGVACAYERTLRPQYPGGKSVYINALEERIAFLEARLPDHAEDHYDNGPEPLQNGSSMSTEEASTTLQPQSSVSRSRRESREDCFSEDHEGDDRTSLVDGVAYLSLCASGTTDTTSEPYYVGSSSGATIARIIQSSIFRSSSKRSGHPPIHQTDQSSKNARPPPPPESIHSEEPTTDFPDWQQARMLFDVFFERIHTRWPLLDRVVYTKLFDKQYIQGALTIIERSIFHLIYAITARFLSLTRKPCGIDSDRHLVAATEPMDYILAQHNLATVQFLILLGVHGQRSPYGAGAWSQIRYATSVCIEMGLHRKRAFIGSPEQARDAEIRRRAFWACYCLDRVTSIVLGRAFAIADRDINVELPSTSPEFWTLTHTEAPDADKVQWSNIEPYIHIIKLDQIQSRIHRTVFRVDRDVFNETSEQHAKLDRKMAKIRADLDEWLRTYPQTPKKENKITWMYDPETGLTLVYCIWRERSLFSYDVLEATRACSQILTIFGEKWPGAVKYRDIFDALSGSLFKTVVNSTSTTTVHTNGSRPLQLDMDAEPAMNGFTSHSRQASHEQVSQSTSQSSKPTLSHLVTDAVKEAFMEVDEEAPGGWQGWRMWNEMVRDDSTPIPGSAMRFDGVAQGQAQTSWNAYEGSAFYGVDPIQDATMQMDNGAMMDSSQWNFGVYR